MEDYFINKNELPINVYVEVALPSGLWASDLVQKPTTGFRSITGGLINLGNSIIDYTLACYMNVCLQCLANTPLVREYLLNDNWKDQVNLMNRMGRRGVLINIFSEVVKEMWKQTCVKPSNLKAVLGKFKEEFYGNQQQDAQELLNFLIDGLHEEVNLVLEKPYFDSSRVQEKEILDAAEECWSFNLRRNWSLFSFLFTGLLGSELTCKTCSKISWSFEPFMKIGRAHV